MPSPFPGMDPYLEDPKVWPDVHHELISEIRGAISRQLRPRYTAMVEDRVYLSDDEDPGRSVIIPDITIHEHDGRASFPSFSDSDGGVALAEPVVVTTLIDTEIHEARLAIYERATQSLVTVIEVLSPSNKVAGSRGRTSYKAKRDEVMQSSVHLVEIDLLRSGMPIIPDSRLPPCEYRVHISRDEERPKGRVWPIRLTQRLPIIPIPLRAPDPDCPLDLQAALNAIYDRVGYDLVVDYEHEPTPPLAEPLSEWARKTIAKASH